MLKETTRKFQLLTRINFLSKKGLYSKTPGRKDIPHLVQNLKNSKNIVI